MSADDRDIDEASAAPLAILGGALSVASLVAGACYCGYLCATHPWAVVQVLASLFVFGAASLLFGFVFIKIIDRWG